MKHPDHVNLLRPANLPPGGVWADFGAGSGAFTLALRELVGLHAQIHAVDKDRGSLQQLEHAYRARFGDASNLHVHSDDFSRPLDLHPLDGALMANSLHYFKDAPSARTPRSPGRSSSLDPSVAASAPWRFHRIEDKLTLLGYIRSLLKPGGTLLLVEYNVDSGNMWVPHPLSFGTWQRLATQAGFSEPRLLATHPSNFLREFYSAVSYKKDT